MGFPHRHEKGNVHSVEPCLAVSHCLTDSFGTLAFQAQRIVCAVPYVLCAVPLTRVGFLTLQGKLSGVTDVHSVPTAEHAEPVLLRRLCDGLCPVPSKIDDTVRTHNDTDLCVPTQDARPQPEVDAAGAHHNDQLSGGGHQDRKSLSIDESATCAWNARGAQARPSEHLHRSTDLL